MGLYIAGLCLVLVASHVPYAHAANRSVGTAEIGYLAPTLLIAAAFTGLLAVAHWSRFRWLASAAAVALIAVSSYLALVAYRDVPEQVAVHLGLDAVPGPAIPVVLAGQVALGAAVLAVRGRKGKSR